MRLDYGTIVTCNNHLYFKIETCYLFSINPNFGWKQRFLIIAEDYAFMEDFPAIWNDFVESGKNGFTMNFFAKMSQYRNMQDIPLILVGTQGEIMRYMTLFQQDLTPLVTTYLALHRGAV